MINLKDEYLIMVVISLVLLVFSALTYFSGAHVNIASTLLLILNTISIGCYCGVFTMNRKYNSRNFVLGGYLIHFSLSVLALIIAKVNIESIPVYETIIKLFQWNNKEINKRLYGVFYWLKIKYEITL